MGSPASEPDRRSVETQHRVTISRSFYLGVYEVTQAQYRAVMGTNPSYFKGDSNPVEKFSWDDVMEFCQRLSAKSGRKIRLPTEAEWEYVCRAGTTTPFNTGTNIGSGQANFNDYRHNIYGGGYSTGRPGVFREKTIPVGSFQPNAWGLYDMHGNVSELCSDRWDGQEDYQRGDVTDPIGTDSQIVIGRVIRGGSWNHAPSTCRSAYRYWARNDPNDHDMLSSRTLGFRVVLEVNPESGPKMGNAVVIGAKQNNAKDQEEKYVQTKMSSNEQKFMSLLQSFKNRGQDVANFTDERGSKHIHNAAKFGYLHTLQWLKDNGADLNAVDRNGYTAAIIAAMNDRIQALQWLKDNGANLNTVHKKSGHTVLHFAAQNNRIPALQWLKDNGVNLNSVTEKGTHVVHLAALNGHVQVLQWLKENGADMNARDDLGMMAAHYAGSGEVLQWLYDNGADMNARDYDGMTPRMVAEPGSQAERWFKSKK